MRLLRKTGVRQPWQPAPLASEWQIVPPRLLINQADPPQSIYSGQVTWVGWRGQFPDVAARPQALQVPAVQPPSGLALWIAPRFDVTPQVESIPRGVTSITPSMPLPMGSVLLGTPPRQEPVVAPKAMVVQTPDVPLPRGQALLGGLPREEPTPPTDAIPKALAIRLPATPVPSASVWQPSPPRPVLAERVPAPTPIVISGSGLPTAGAITLWSVAPREQPAAPAERLSPLQLMQAPATQPPAAVAWTPQPLRQERTDRLSLTQVLRAPAAQPPGAVVWQPTPFRQLPELRTGGLQLTVVGVPGPLIGASVVWSFAWRESQAVPGIPRHLHLSPRSQHLTLQDRSTNLTLSPRSQTLTLPGDRE